MEKLVLKANSKYFDGLIATCILALGILSFFRILGFDFTDVDALSLIQTGRFHSFYDIWKILSRELMQGRMPNATYYRPLLSLFYGIQGNLFGLTPWPYHLVDLLLHGTNATLVYFLCRALMPGISRPWSFLAALFFLWHPLQVENVAAIARQGDLWVTTFILTALLTLLTSLIKPELHQPCFWISVILVFLSPFLKEPGIIAGPLMVWAIFLKERSLKATFRLGFPFVAASLIFLGIRTLVLNGVGGYVSAPANETQIAHFFSWMKADVLGHFFGFTFAGFSSARIQQLYLLLRHPSWMWALFWIGFLGSLMAYIYRRRKNPTILLCLGFIFLQFVMTYLSFFLFRYLYLTLAPFAVLLVWEINQGWKHIQRRKVSVAGGLAVFCFLPAFWAGPVVNFEPYERWQQSAAISREFLKDLQAQVENHPDAQNIMVLSIPYKKYFRPPGDYFWEIPMTQILLDHALQDFLKMTFPHRSLNLIGLSYIQILGNPVSVTSKAEWTERSTLSLQVSNAAQLIEYPWVKIPGRVAGSEQFKLHILSQGPGNSGQVILTPDARALPNALYLLPKAPGEMVALLPPPA